MATLRQLPAGRWQAMIRKSGVKPISKTFRTKEMARTWARRKEDEMERGIYHSASAAERTILKQVIHRYKSDITPRKAGARKEISKLNLLDDRLGAYTLSRLTPEVVVDFVDQRKKEVGSDTIRRELSTLSHVIRTARSLWRIHLPENAVHTALDILSATRTLSPKVYRVRRLKDGEETRLVEAAHSEIRDIIPFALDTAMRRGEIARAKTKDVEGYKLHVPTTKSNRPRTIPLPDRALTIVQARIDRHDGRLFGIQPDSLTQSFGRACNRAGISDLRFHDLRHEATSRLFEQGMEIQEVAAITGHSDWRSLKIYVHVLPERIAAKLRIL